MLKIVKFSPTDIVSEYFVEGQTCIKQCLITEGLPTKLQGNWLTGRFSQEKREGYHLSLDGL